MRALRHVKAISVIERLDIPMMQSNPQLCEIKAAFADAMAETPGISADHPHAEVLPADRPAWAAATCAPATSSPWWRTCAARSRATTSPSASSTRRRCR